MRRYQGVRPVSDNGQEFGEYFHSALQTQRIVHWHTFPRTPKMNAHCERFNRTVHEEFLDVHEALQLRSAPVQPAAPSLARLAQFAAPTSLPADAHPS
jgi:transposase InsO family protein